MKDAEREREGISRICTHSPGLPSSAMLEGGQFPDPRHHANPHAGATEKRSQEEGRRGRCRGIAGEQTGELLVLMVLPVAGGRRQVLMVQLMMVGVRGDGAAAKDVLDEERRPAGGGSVLAWLSLLLLAGRLHLFLVRRRNVLRLRHVHASRGCYILDPGRPGHDAEVARSSPTATIPRP